MVVKFMNSMINVNKMKYIKFYRHGYQPNRPFVVIKFIDGETIRFNLEEDDIKEYERFKSILKSNSIK